MEWDIGVGMLGVCDESKIWQVKTTRRELVMLFKKKTKNKVQMVSPGVIAAYLLKEIFHLKICEPCL